MPITQANLESAQMTAREKYARWKRKNTETWTAPLRETLIAMHWRGLPGQIKDYHRQTIPDAARVMDERYGGTNGNQV